MAISKAQLDAFEAGMSVSVQRQVMDATFRNPEEWLWDAFGGRASSSGVRVNAYSALTYAYVYASVNIIGGDVGSLPLNVYRVDSDGDKVLAEQHYAHWLLNHQPNGLMTGNVFRETVTMHALLCGTGFAGIERDMTGTPKRLVLFEPGHVKTDVVDGMLVHTVSGYGMEPFKVPDRDMLRVQGLSWSGTRGMILTDLARNSWGLGMAEETHGASHFKHGGRPSVLIKVAGRFDKQKADQYLEAYEKRHGSVDGAGRAGIVFGDVDITPFPTENTKGQWDEARRFQRVEVATWFRLPPHMLGDSEKVAYNSLSAEKQAYLSMTLRQWLNKWEQECRAKLLPERVRRNGSVLFEHDPSALIQGDRAAYSETIIGEVGAMLRTRNEGRRALGLPHVEGGDEFENPNTSTSGTQDTPEDEPAASMAAHRNLVVTAIQRILRAQGRRMAQVAKKPPAKGFLVAVDDFYNTWTAMEDSLEPILTACSSVPGLAVGMTAAEAAGKLAEECRLDLVEVAGYSHHENLAENVTETVSTWPAKADAAASWILGD